MYSINVWLDYILGSWTNSSSFQAAPWSPIVLLLCALSVTHPFQILSCFPNCWMIFTSIAFLKTFYFEIITESQEVAERFLCILHPVSSTGYILYNCSTIWSQGINIGISMCIGMYHFTTCVYLYNHHHSQDTELVYFVGLKRQIDCSLT